MSRFVCVKDFENHAFKVLPKNALDYYKSGAGAENTLELNKSAFKEYNKQLKNFSQLKIN